MQRGKNVNSITFRIISASKNGVVDKDKSKQSYILFWLRLHQRPRSNGTKGGGNSCP